jgi:DNA-binding transcriptional MocR family regulator
MPSGAGIHPISSQRKSTTGGSISLHVAHSLLQAAERHGFYLVEDDTFADILPRFSPRLAALDQLRRVLYVGTFAKTLSASLRVGYLAAEPALAQALSDIKLLTTVATSDHVERFVFSLIAGGHYLRHLRRLRHRVEDATTMALHDLSNAGLQVPHGHGGGFYLWAELPADMDEAMLCREAAASSIFLAPGSVFHPGKEVTTPAIRINVAHASNPRFLMFIKNALRKSKI